MDSILLDTVHPLFLGPATTSKPEIGVRNPEAITLSTCLAAYRLHVMLPRASLHVSHLSRIGGDNQIGRRARGYATCRKLPIKSLRSQTPRAQHIRIVSFETNMTAPSPPFSAEGAKIVTYPVVHGGRYPSQRTDEIWLRAERESGFQGTNQYWGPVLPYIVGDSMVPSEECRTGSNPGSIYKLSRVGRG